MSLVERRLKRLVGEDPLLTERLWWLVWEIDRIEEIPVRHLGILDCLLWDIKSKKAGMPIYQMLGGNDPKVPAYASTVTWDTMEEYERHIKHCMDVGFTRVQAACLGRRQGGCEALPQPAQVGRPRRRSDVRRLGRLGLRDLDLVRPRARGVRLPLVRGADARVRARSATRSCATRWTSRCLPPRRRTAATGTWRPGSRWARST